MVENSSVFSESISETDIAIVGMAGQFPKAANVEEYWTNLETGRECITFFSDEELQNAGVPAYSLRDPNYVKATAVLDGYDCFDASFFGFSPKEAQLIDPQHRLFLEQAWTVLEQAGYNTNAYGGSIGVYTGVGLNTYLLYSIYPHILKSNDLDTYQVQIRNDKDFLPTLVSYKLNLRGPSLSIQTACSTSLVAVHVACQALINGECDMALAGGVTVVANPAGYVYTEGMILSPDGHCRAFDAKAQGTVLGNGVGVVLLKRLELAIADGDTIHAVIKGSAINNDGSAKVGYTAPSVEGQAAVIAEAQAIAGTPAETITYVEAHGTGTTLGDPIEITALTKAFRHSTDAQQFCAIGSVKTNIGHLDTAAGIASLIKVTLALKHRLIPPSLNFETGNPAIQFAQSPFFVNTQLRPWTSPHSPRRAGVSSFGIGGTNAHVIVEEAPPLALERQRDRAPATQPWQLLLLSAKSEAALQQQQQNLAHYLTQNPDLDLRDVAYTLARGRQPFTYRWATVVQTTSEAIEALENAAPTAIARLKTDNRINLAFCFPGQGSQAIGVGRDLYAQEPLFREILDTCAELLRPLLNADIRQVLYPHQATQKPAQANQANGTKPNVNNPNGTKPFNGHLPSMDRLKAEIEADINQTQWAQPILFAVEYALAKLWMSWGIQPDVMLGHSLGEYVAACLAGVFSLEEGLRLVAQRAKLMQQLPPGAMLAIPGTEAEVMPWLNQDLSLAASNGGICTVSGTVSAIAQLEEMLITAGISPTRLKTSHAFHSPLVNTMVESFRQLLGQITWNQPQLAYLSNVTGTWITPEEATDPEYWIRHLRQGVRFGENVGQLLPDPNWVFLEVGPGRTLTALIRRHPAYTEGQALLNTLAANPKAPEPDTKTIRQTLSQLWLQGISPKWKRFFGTESLYRLPLPTYPFERQRHWMEPPTGEAAITSFGLARNPDPSRWYYAPTWQQLPTLVPSRPESWTSQCWLLLIDEHGLGHSLAQRLISLGQRVITVAYGERRWGVSADYFVKSGEASRFVPLLANLKAQGSFPHHIVHLWSLTKSKSIALDPTAIAEQNERGLYALLDLAQAIGKIGQPHPLQLSVLGQGSYNLLGTESLNPISRMLVGVVKVIPQEYSQIACRYVDLTEEFTQKHPPLEAIDHLLADLQQANEPMEVAYRGQARWVSKYQLVPVVESESPINLRHKGLYMITGGMGGIGLTLAKYLAETVQARLLLISRTPLPPRREWREWCATHPEEDRTRQKIEHIWELENLGARVWLGYADITNLPAMNRLVERVEAEVGPVRGILHCAGVSDFGGMIQGRDRSATEKILSAKVTGTWGLEQIFRDRPLDFWFISSSLSTVLYKTMFGQVGYAAANEFLNGFCDYQQQIYQQQTKQQQAKQTQKRRWSTLLPSSQPTPVTRIVAAQWTEWDDVGMAVDARAERLKTKARTEEDGDWLVPLRPNEGTQVFARLLTQPHTNVAVCMQDLNLLLRQQAEWSAEQWLDSLELDLDHQTPKQARPDLVTVYVAPSSQLEEQLITGWEAYLGIHPIGVNDNFYDLGGDSLLALGFLAYLEKQLSLPIPITVLLENPTVEGLSSYLQITAPETVAQWLTPIAPVPPSEPSPAPLPPTDSPNHLSDPKPAMHPSSVSTPAPLRSHPTPLLVPLRTSDESQPNFFLIHPIGGGVSGYMPLAAHLSQKWNTYGIRAVGLENETTPINNIEYMASLYLQTVRKKQPVGPYYLGGWSMGGIVAYEMTRQLLNQGDTVKALIMIDSPEPIASKRDALSDFKVFVRGLGFSSNQVKEFMQSLDAQVNWINSDLSQLLKDAHRLGILPQALGLEHIQQMYAVFKAHSEALSHYTAQPCQMMGSTLLLQASNLDRTILDGFAFQPNGAWARLLPRSLNTRRIPGDHFSLVTEPHVAQVGTYINAILSQHQPMSLSMPLF